MIEVLPAILPKNYEDLKNKIATVRGVVRTVQVDLCDGIFVPSLTWPFLSPVREDVEFLDNDFDLNFTRILNEQEGMPFWEDMDFELDLMVMNAVQNFDVYTKLGPKRIIFHLESVGDLEEFKNFLEGMDNYIRDTIEFGIAFKPSMPLENIYPLISVVDFVQFMGNDRIGYQGVTLDEKIYEKIRTLRSKYPDLPIGIDIGVNTETAPKLVEAGVTKLAAGSAIFSADDIIGTIERFQQL
jgi:pentose-5-phosphate-3-epimerase